MSRCKLSEYRAKSLLADDYHGVSLKVGTLDADIGQLDPTASYIVKVDQGVKKRGKKGLIRLDVASQDVSNAIHELAAHGYEQFIAEPMIPHDKDEECYVSFERTREGIQIQFSPHGGVDIEDNAATVQHYAPEDVPLPQSFVLHIIATMNREHWSFVEINPLVVQDEVCTPLDAAVLVDSAAAHTSWNETELVEDRIQNSHEAAIADLHRSSTAAFSFRVLHPDGAIWLLLSGGGASITLADEAANQGKADLVGNYGEYSGGPTTEETYLYACHVIDQALESAAPRKALVIAGGVANFTDVKKTFSGIIRALREREKQLVDQACKIFVRRGGPHEQEGLAGMRQYLQHAGLFGSVHGSDTILTDVIHEALEYVDA
jgi:succinyl-CoA synthetase beta subunit